MAETSRLVNIGYSGKKIVIEAKRIFSSMDDIKISFGNRTQEIS